MSQFLVACFSTLDAGAQAMVVARVLSHPREQWDSVFEVELVNLLKQRYGFVETFSINNAATMVTGISPDDVPDGGEDEPARESAGGDGGADTEAGGFPSGFPSGTDFSSAATLVGRRPDETGEIDGISDDATQITPSSGAPPGRKRSAEDTQEIIIDPQVLRNYPL